MLIIAYTWNPSLRACSDFINLRHELIDVDFDNFFFVLAPIIQHPTNGLYNVGFIHSLVAKIKSKYVECRCSNIQVIYWDNRLQIWQRRPNELKPKFHHKKQKSSESRMIMTFKVRGSRQHTIKRMLKSKNAWDLSLNQHHGLVPTSNYATII